MISSFKDFNVFRKHEDNSIMKLLKMKSNKIDHWTLIFMNLLKNQQTVLVRINPEIQFLHIL